MNVHETIIHAKCPINQSWDYYTVRVSTDEFVPVEEIEELCDFVRGKNLSQEQIADNLVMTLPNGCSVVVEGRHGQNCKTTCTRGER